MHEGGISIWFFIGICLLVTGVLIFGSGIQQYVSPPPPEHRVVLFNLHADIWWGAIMIVVGLVYTVGFRPSRTGATH